MGLSSKEFSLMQKYIQEHCGIVIGEDKAYLIESRLSRLLVDSGLSSFEELYHVIAVKNDPYIAEKVIDAMTTNETMWFRDKTPWLLLEEKLLPQYIEELRAGKRMKVRIWSAACSTGQEPYSTAMCIDNYLTKHGIRDIGLDRFEILATDISHEVLEIAKMGRYDSISIMRGLDPIYKERYFSAQGRVWSLNEKITKAVRFQQFNLQNSYMLLGKFDMVFCRYVLIYFSDDLKRAIVKKIADTLVEAGIFAIGNSELFAGDRELFNTMDFNNSVYFVKK